MPSRAYQIGVFLTVVGIANIAIAIGIHWLAADERARTESALARSAAPAPTPPPSATPSALPGPLPPDSAPPTATPTLPPPSSASEPLPTSSASKTLPHAKELDWRKAVDACDQCNAKACLDLADRDARGGPNRAPMPGAGLISPSVSR